MRVEELSPVDPYSASWRYRLDLRLAAFEVRQLRDYQLAWSSHCGRAATVMEGDAAQTAWKLASESMKVVRKLYLPWQEEESIESPTSVNRLQQKWEEEFGSMDDPAVRAAINSTARALIESARRSRSGMFNRED